MGKRMTKKQVKQLQRDLNEFCAKYLKGFAPLMVDGDFGPATRKRILEVKFYLGYVKSKRDASVDRQFRRRLNHPQTTKYASAKAIKRGKNRRKKQRRHYRKTRFRAVFTPGVTTFDGRPVAKWLKPYLEWARANGWRGTLNSGWRDPNYSRQLCYRICGAPSCPGRCAGTSSNHVGNAPPRGAIDVSDYVTFGNLIRRAPFPIKIFNALGAQDPVHFSSTGR